MKSRELGLVLARQLMQVEDLHYGYWETGEKPSLTNLAQAQARFSEMLIGRIGEFVKPGGRILDIGCGTGNLLVQLLAQGYEVDGLIPDTYLESQVRERLSTYNGTYQPTIFSEKFEQLGDRSDLDAYDLLLFSESFQYIPYVQSVALWPGLMKPDGQVMICDFFKSQHDGDEGPGDGTFRGGHVYDEFLKYIQVQDIPVLLNEDITSKTSPSIELLDDLLMNRAKPALNSIDEYLEARRPILRKLGKWLFRRNIKRVQTKYLSGHRSKATFERYKTYRLMVLKPAST